MKQPLVGTLLPCFLLLTAITSRGLACGSSSKEDGHTKCSKSDSEHKQKKGHSKETGDRQKDTDTYPSVFYEYIRPAPLFHKQACYYQNQVSYLPRRSSSWYQSNKPSYPRYYMKRPSYRPYSVYKPQAMPLYEWPSYSPYGFPYQSDSYEDYPLQPYNSYYRTYPIYSDDEPNQPFASEDLDSPNYVGSDNDYDIKSNAHNYYCQRKPNIYYPADDYNDHASPVDNNKHPKDGYLLPREMKRPPPNFNGTEEVSSPDGRFYGALGASSY